MSVTPRRRTLVSWRSGKDSAWTLHELTRAGDVEVVGLLSTLSEPYDRVAMHAVHEAGFGTLRREYLGLGPDRRDRSGRRMKHR